MHFKFIIFLTIILTFSAGMHFAFFASIIRFFRISGFASKCLLYTVMAILTVSFISSFILLRLNENPWAVGYYQFAATWMGFLIHFLVAIVIIWILIGAARLAGFSINQKFIALFFLSAAVGGSFLGMWNAFHPAVEEVVVPVRHLSKNWQQKTIVQISDVHLGYFHGKKFAERLVAKVNNLNPDLILITGDLFDGMGGNFEQLVEPINRLYATHGVYFVIGNHEHYVGIEQTEKLLKKSRLRVLDNELVDIDGLQLIGISYPGIRAIEDISNLSDDDQPQKTRILLFHTPTNILLNTGDRMDQHYNTYWTPDVSFDFAQKLNIDLQLSGHTHHGQIFPFNFLSRLLHKGYDYGLVKNGDFHIYTSCGIGTWGPPMRTAGRSEIVRIRLESEE